MPSPIKLVPLFALGSLASTVVQSIFFFASTDTNAYVGSVVATASGLTTYDIACTSGASACVTGESVRITEGSSTFAWTTTIIESAPTGGVAGVTGNVKELVSETCTVAGTTSATCVAAVTVVANGESTATTSTTTLGTESFGLHPITITAGAELLGSATSATGNAAPMVTGMGVAGAAVLGLAALL